MSLTRRSKNDGCSAHKQTTSWGLGAALHGNSVCRLTGNNEGLVEWFGQCSEQQRLSVYVLNTVYLQFAHHFEGLVWGDCAWNAADALDLRLPNRLLQQ
jgi:hypothetical protein